MLLDGNMRKGVNNLRLQIKMFALEKKTNKTKQKNKTQTNKQTKHTVSKIETL